MKLQKIEYYPECPRCNSLKTGLIEADKSYNIQAKAKVTAKALSKGHYIKFVSPEKFRNYYKACSINMFCYDCDYEFRGEPEIRYLETEEYEELIEQKNLKEQYFRHIPYSKNRFTIFFEKRKKLKELKLQNISNIKME